MPPRTPSRRRAGSRPSFAIGEVGFSAAILIIIGATVACLLVLVALHASEESRYARAEAARYVAPSATLPTIPSPPDSSKTLGLALAKRTGLITIGVVGDSTGDDPTEWVALTARWISSHYDRRVQLHHWNIGTEKYDTTATYGTSGPLVTIWNGSAPGQNVTYSVNVERQLLPGSAYAAIFISHGHNEGDAADLTTHLTQLLTTVRQTAGKSPVIVIGQNPNTTPDTTDQAGKVQAALNWAAANSLQSIDVYKEFEKVSDPNSLLDAQHTNAQGSQLWASTVEARIAS